MVKRRIARIEKAFGVTAGDAVAIEKLVSSCLKKCPDKATFFKLAGMDDEALETLRTAPGAEAMNLMITKSSTDFISTTREEQMAAALNDQAARTSKGSMRVG